MLTIPHARPDPLRAENPHAALRRKLLVIQLWGIGDLTMATPLLAAAADHYDVTLLAKPHARPLLSPTLPRMTFIEWDAPWTAFSGKYRLWRWNWSAVRHLVVALRRGKFDVAVAGRRNDPRDHFLMRLAGIPKRMGYPFRPTLGRLPFGLPELLTDPIDPGPATRHVVDDWRLLAGRLGLNDTLEPYLDGPAYPVMPGGQTGTPVLCLHPGARIPVRRWPEAEFAETIRRLRSRFRFELLLIADPDGYGLGLAPLADRVIKSLPLDELVGVLASCAMLLCNDSGPGHVAAACGRPVLAVFGPTDPIRFSPRGPQSHVVIRDSCAHRPCMDDCRFPEPYCLTRLTAGDVWQEIEAFTATVLPTRT